MHPSHWRPSEPTTSPASMVPKQLQFWNNNWQSNTNNHAHSSNNRRLGPSSNTAIPYTFFQPVHALPSASESNNDQLYANAEVDNFDYYDGGDYDGEGNHDDNSYDALGRREQKLAKKKQSYHCDICNVSCSGHDNYEAHLEGKNHKKKAAAAGTPGMLQVSVPKKKAAYHCEICNVDCSGEDVYQAHLAGQKHQKGIKCLLHLNKPIPSAEALIISPVLDQNNTGTKRHRRKESSAKENPNTIPLGGFAGVPIPETINDRLLLDKLEKIQLDPGKSEALEQLTLLIEESLYAVSIIIESNRASALADQLQILRGIMRVGLLEDHLFLNSDQRADLVVLCSVIPTLDLLTSVASHFRRVLNQNEANIVCENNIVVREMPDEAAVAISQQGIPITIFVTLTCSAMHQWSPGDLNYHPYHEPPNALPKYPCLLALAKMRRTKFYKVKCAPHQSMASTVKIVREFARRVPTWSRLNDWVIILIVEKVLSFNDNPYGPSAALKALLTAIANKQILGPDFQLPDPCEKLPIDAVATLSSVDRSNLFASARYSLKQMNTNNLAKLLALDGPGIPSEHEPRSKKLRINDNGEDAAGVSSFTTD